MAENKELDKMTRVRIYNIKKHTIYENTMEALLDAKTEKIKALGTECQEALDQQVKNGASPSDYVLKKLINNYEIVDLTLCEKVLKFFIRAKSQADIKQPLFKDKALLYVHTNFVDIYQKRPFEDAVYASGFKKVFVMDNSVQGIPAGVSNEDFIWQYCEENKITCAVEFFY